jgi:LysM repeat protein
MSRRSPARRPARFLAPVALVAFAVVLLVVVTSSGRDDSKQGSRPAATTKSKSARSGQGASRTSTRSTTPPRTYVVKPGDNFSVIAERTGVSVARILALNPKADPQSLVAGQRLKLRP